MRPGWSAYGIIFGVAFGVTFVMTPVARRIAVRRGVVVEPGPRRVNDRTLPMLGGAAMLVALLVALLVAWRMQAFSLVFTASLVPLAVAVSSIMICAVGTLDDVREVSAPAKTAGIVLAGSVLYLLGVSMLYLRIPFAGILVLSSEWSPLISVLWVLGMTNAVNLIDGLDGLAAGIVAIAAGSFFLYGHHLMGAGTITADNASPLLSLIVCGICLGFLPWNFNPAKIIMGDGGALLLGLLMAAATMLVGGQNNDPFSGQAFFFFAPLLIPLVILGVPILDTAWAIIRRARGRQGIAHADKGHLHHRLMDLGHGQRRSVVILWAWTALLSGLVLYPVFSGRGNGYVPIGMAGLALILYTWFHPRARESRRPRHARRRVARDGAEQAADGAADGAPAHDATTASAVEQP